MICKNCNKEIPDGNDFCTECGAPLEEPIVINMTKEDIKNANKKVKEKRPVKEEKSVNKSVEKPKLEAEGPFINISGYIKSLGSNTSNLLGLVGALLLFYSPFMTWLWEELTEVKKKASLFDLGGKNADLAIDAPVIVVMSILILITAFSMLALSARENIRLLRPFAYNTVVRLVPVAVAVVILIVILNNDKYSMSLEIINDMVESANKFGSSHNYDGGRGAGIVLYILGTVIYALSVVFDMGKVKKNG